MSLYWHVASKDELLDLMLDAVEGDRENPEPSGDWRRDMREVAGATRQSLHEHPWMMDFIGGRPPAGPKSLRNLERTLAYFDGLGLDIPPGHRHRHHGRYLRHGRGAARGAGAQQRDLHRAGTSRS